MRQIRCNGCRGWFETRHQTCPDCGHPRHAFNKWLRTATLNNQLYGMAEQSVAQDKAVSRA